MLIIEHKCNDDMLNDAHALATTIATTTTTHPLKQPPPSGPQQTKKNKTNMNILPPGGYYLTLLPYSTRCTSAPRHRTSPMMPNTRPSPRDPTGYSWGPPVCPSVCLSVEWSFFKWMQKSEQTNAESIRFILAHICAAIQECFQLNESIPMNVSWSIDTSLAMVDNDVVASCREGTGENVKSGERSEEMDAHDDGRGDGECGQEGSTLGESSGEMERPNKQKAAEQESNFVRETEQRLSRSVLFSAQKAFYDKVCLVVIVFIVQEIAVSDNMMITVMISWKNRSW